MRKLFMQRGSTNEPDYQSYFYVEKSSEGGMSDLVKELKVNRGTCETTVQTVFSLHSRSVVAFEFDPVQRAMRTSGADKKNILFLIDDGFTLKKLN